VNRLLLLGVLFSGSSAFALDAVPQPHPPSRYENMAQQWPFAVATPVVPVVEKGPSVFNQMHVVGVLRRRDASGQDQDTVWLKNNADQTTFAVKSNGPPKEGFSIAGIEWSDRVGKGTVTMKNGTEFGKLQFDQSAVAAPPLPPPGPAANGIPQPNRGGNRLPVVPRPSITPQAATQPGPAPAAGESRRRVRVINTP
jgi:hypothetical protein